jgi:CheY-like chemotaxis protein
VMKGGNGETLRVTRLREIMERQCLHLAHLVDDLLDVSRLTREQITLHREEVALETALRNAEATVQPLILARQHHLSVSVPPEGLVLDADPVRLEQILVNLLTNAAKYTPPGGHIWCDAEAVEEGGRRWAVIRVRDNGVGISADFLPHVFDLFAQADRSLDRRDGGLGIGLTLVQRLVSQHHGEISVRSAGIGKGAEFTVRMPAVAKPRQAPVVSAPAEPLPGRPARILLVEDNYDAAETMAELLDLWGHQVNVARDGRAAVVTAERDQPEVILLDIGLPLLSGYEVAERLRSSIQVTRQPVIIGLSGYGQPEDRERGAQAGFDYHLVKPVDADELRGLLERVTAARLAQRLPQKA